MALTRSEPDQVFRPIAIKTNASRAVEAAYAMAERDFGVTDIKDNLRQGDVPVKAPPPINTAEAEAMTRELVGAGAVREDVAPHLQPMIRNFWGAGGGAGMAPAMAQQVAPMVQAAPAAAREARAEGSDPMAILHAAGKKGLDPTAKSNLTIHGSF